VGDVKGNVYAWDNKRLQLVGRAAALPGSVSAVRVHAATRSLLALSVGAQGSDVKLLRIVSEPGR
jgi:hypothetical protein